MATSRERFDTTRPDKGAIVMYEKSRHGGFVFGKVDRVFETDAVLTIMDNERTVRTRKELALLRVLLRGSELE